MNSSFGAANQRVIDQGEAIIPAGSGMAPPITIDHLPGERVWLELAIQTDTGFLQDCVGLPIKGPGMPPNQLAILIFQPTFGPQPIDVLIKWTCMGMRISNA